MQAMIFAAGKGTRLKPLTDVIPKALVPVGAKPLLQHVAEKLTVAGVDNIVVNVHHHAPQLRNFISLLSKAMPCRFSVSDESDHLLETGGGIKKARGLFRADQPVLIHNCDILSNVDLCELYRQAHGNDATLLVSSRTTQRYLIFNDAMRLVGWTNTATGEVKSPYPEIAALSQEADTTATAGASQPHTPIDWASHGLRLYAFSGIHVISPSLFPLMDQWQDRFPIIDFYLHACASAGIRGIVGTDLRLLDVGKLDTLAGAEEFLENNVQI